MIADGSCRVAERVVRSDNRGAFAEVRLEGALPHVAGIDEDDCSAVTRPRGTQVLQVTGQQGEAAATVFGKNAAVKVIRADDRQGNG